MGRGMGGCEVVGVMHLAFIDVSRFKLGVETVDCAGEAGPKSDSLSVSSVKATDEAGASPFSCSLARTRFR